MQVVYGSPLSRMLIAGFLAVALFGDLSHAVNSRSLQQQYSSASAVSVSGGQGPFGNCGTTQSTGNAAAYASGPPCGSKIIPAPPPLASCPSTTVTVDWKKPAEGSGYKNLTLCTGSTVAFKWNTGKPSITYSLYQIPTLDCPASATDKNVKLIISSASSPNPAGKVTAKLNAPGEYYFADIDNCKAGQVQAVIIPANPGEAFAPRIATNGKK